MGKRICLKFKKSLVEQIRKGVSYASINGQYRDKYKKKLGVSTYQLWKRTADTTLNAETKGKTYLRVKERSDEEQNFQKALLRKAEESKRAVAFDDLHDFCLTSKG